MFKNTAISTEIKNNKIFNFMIEINNAFEKLITNKAVLWDYIAWEIFKSKLNEKNL